MSVKFEKDSVKTTVGAAAKQVSTTVKSGKVANGYLAVRLPCDEVCITID